MFYFPCQGEKSTPIKFRGLECRGIDNGSRVLRSEVNLAVVTEQVQMKTHSWIEQTLIELFSSASEKCKMCRHAIVPDPGPILNSENYLTKTGKGSFSQVGVQLADINQLVFPSAPGRNRLFLPKLHYINVCTPLTLCSIILLLNQ